MRLFILFWHYQLNNVEKNVQLHTIYGTELKSFLFFHSLLYVYISMFLSFLSRFLWSCQEFFCFFFCRLIFLCNSLFYYLHFNVFSSFSLFIWCCQEFFCFIYVFWSSYVFIFLLFFLLYFHFIFYFQFFLLSCQEFFSFLFSLYVFPLICLISLFSPFLKSFSFLILLAISFLNFDSLFSHSVSVIPFCRPI